MKNKIQKMFEPSRSILKGNLWAGWGQLRNYVPRSKFVRSVRDRAKKDGKLLEYYHALLDIELFNMGIISGWATAMRVHGLESHYPKETRIISRELRERSKKNWETGRKDPLDRIWFRKMTGWEEGLGKKEIMEMKGV